MGAGACTPARVGRAYCYNLFGLQRFKVYGEEPIPAGEHQVRMEFAYDGGGLAKGGTVSLYVDGAKAGEGRVEGTVPMVFSGDETTDVGSDGGTPVSDDFGPKDSRFNGRVRWVQIDLDTDDMTTSSAPRSACGSPWPDSDRTLGRASLRAGRVGRPALLLGADMGVHRRYGRL